MNYKIKFLNSAFDDIDEIDNNICALSGDSVTSQRYIQSFFKALAFLEMFPFMYRSNVKNYYSLQVGSHTIFYKVLEEEKVVLIHRIVSNRRNFEDILE